MRIPKKVKIGGSVYKIKNNVKLIDGNPDCYGLCDFIDKTIQIKDKQNRQAREEALIHEIIHALFFHMNMEQDEDLVERIAQALHMLIKDNPELFR